MKRVGQGMEIGAGDWGSRWMMLVMLSLVLAVILFLPGTSEENAAWTLEEETIALLPVIAREYMEPSGVFSADWPTLRHDAARTGYNAGEKDLYPPLQKAWTAELDDAFAIDFVTSAGADVAVTGIEADHDDPNMVMMFSAGDGTEKWARLLPDGAGAMEVGATFSEDSVYVSGQGEKHLYALRRETGSAKWMKAGFSNFFMSQMAVVNELLYVPDRDAGAVAIAAESGQFVWSDGFSGIASFGPIAYRGGIVYGWRDRSELVALTGLDGREIWSYAPVPPLRTLSYPWIIVGPEYLFVQTGDWEFAALDSLTGQVLYRKTFGEGSYFWYQVLIDDQLVGTIWTNTVKNIVALDAVDGSLVWQIDLMGQTVRDMVGANGILYFVLDSAVIAASADDGRIIWQHALDPDHIAGNMAIANGTLYVTYEDRYDAYLGGLIALRRIQ